LSKRLSKYKDTIGRYRTQSLFYETNQSKERPVFTLKPQDHKGLPSMKRLYLEQNDPTEYSFAIGVLGSLEAWIKLSNASWFSKYIDAWRDELELKLRSEAISKMRNLAEDGNKDATKWLAEKGWEKRAAGRPTKQQISDENRKKERVLSSIDDDAERLGLGSTTH